MIPPFAEALGDLLAKYCDVESLESMIATMETALAGMYDDEKFQASEPRSFD
jgi:hypothetical protein